MSAALLLGLAVVLLLAWRNSRRRKDTQLQGYGLERLKRRGVL